MVRRAARRVNASYVFYKTHDKRFALCSNAPMASPTFSPLYRQIKGLLVESLRSGEWRPGEAIPSEIELAARFRVSQGTVRKAIDELALENLVVRRQGKGTFVATHGEREVRFRFLRLTPDSGRPAPAERHLLEFRRARASGEWARLLELKSGDTVFSLKRLLLFAGAPIIAEEIWLPGNVFRGLSAAAISEHKGALYNLFETQFGIRAVRAEEKLKAVAADASSAELMKLKPGHPLLQVERLTCTYGDKPVEWRRSLYNTDHHFYRSELG
jgi:GntR family transcriptional regulator